MVNLEDLKLSTDIRMGIRCIGLVGELGTCASMWFPTTKRVFGTIADSDMAVSSWSNR